MLKNIMCTHLISLKTYLNNLPKRKATKKSIECKIYKKRNLQFAFFLLDVSLVITHFSETYRGLAGGGVCTRLPPLFLLLIGADILGRLVLMVLNGRDPSSLSRFLSGVIKHCPKFSLLQVWPLWWMKWTMSDSGKDFLQIPQIRMS